MTDKVLLSDAVSWRNANFIFIVLLWLATKAVVYSEVDNRHSRLNGPAGT